MAQWQSTSRNAVEVNTHPLRTVVWVHESALSTAFWGLSRKFLEGIGRNGRDLCIVLLNAREGAYVATAPDVAGRTGNLWHLASDDAYKVHENYELDGLAHYETSAATIHHVISCVAPAA